MAGKKIKYDTILVAGEGESSYKVYRQHKARLKINGKRIVNYVVEALQQVDSIGRIFIRITSYNVCYTKLLRQAFRGQRDAAFGALVGEGVIGALGVKQGQFVREFVITSYSIHYTKLYEVIKDRGGGSKGMSTGGEGPAHPKE